LNSNENDIEQFDDAIFGLENRWQFALEGTGDGVWDYDFQTGVNIASKRMKEILGFDMSLLDADFFLNDWSERLHEDSQAETMAVFQKVLDNETDIYVIEQRVRCEDGNYKWLLTRGKVVSRSDDGMPTRMIGTSTDLTERKKSEEDLKLYQFVMENAPIMILFVDATARIRFANKAALDNYGYTKEELLDLSVPEINPVYTIEMWHKHWQVLKNKKAVLTETLHQRKNGEIFPIEAAANYIEFGDKAYNVAFIKDTTERKKIEKVLYNSEKELRSIFDKLQDTYYRTDIEGQLIMVSPSVEGLMGETSDEILGKKLADYYVDPSGREKFITTLREQGGSVRNYEAEIRREDGNTIWVSTNAQFLRDENDTVIGVEGAIRDISEHKALENQLRQSQKLEALGTLVGGIAHEFNNSLAAIVGNLFIAKQEAASMPRVVRLLDNVEDLAFDSSELIKSLLSFARKDIVKKVPIILNEELKEILKLQRIALPENIELLSDISEETMVCEGDPNLFQQMILNIINNAGDALGNTTHPSISVRLKPFIADRSFFIQFPECKAKMFANITICDNGSGIDAANMPHIFEPFHTTKPVGKGTGLGLSMVFGTIQSHQGALQVDSQPGLGTRVDIYLPISEPKDPHATVDKKDVMLRGKGETILLVDDNESVIETISSILELLNYKVLTANNGQEALETYHDFAEEIDLVLSDVVMPIMGGVEAVIRMRESSPQLKVVFMTGYDRNDIQKLKEDHIAMETIVSKPLKIPDFSLLLRNKLDN